MEISKYLPHDICSKSEKCRHVSIIFYSTRENGECRKMINKSLIKVNEKCEKCFFKEHSFDLIYRFNRQNVSFVFEFFIFFRPVESYSVTRLAWPTLQKWLTAKIKKKGRYVNTAEELYGLLVFHQASLDNFT